MKRQNGERMSDQWMWSEATAATVEVRNSSALQQSVFLSSAALRCGVELQSQHNVHSRLYGTCK